MLSHRFGPDRRRAEGVPMDNFPRIHYIGIFDEIQNMMTESKCEPEQFKRRIIFMSVYNDMDWWNRGNEENCIANALRVTEYARTFTQGHRSFLGPGSEKKWYGTRVNKPDGERDKIAEGMMLNFAESGHPVFRATSALGRGEMKRKRTGKKSFHFNGCDETIEWILRTGISINQLSVYGAAADLCKEMARDSSGAGKPAANENVESMVTPTEFPIAYPVSQTDAEEQRELLREYEQKFAELLEQDKLTKLCSNALEEYWQRTILHYTWWRRSWRFDRIMSRVYFISKLWIILRERVGPWKHEDRSSPGCKGLLSSRTSRRWDHDRILILRPNSFLGSHRERNQQTRDRNVRRNYCCRCWEQRYRETFHEG